MDDGDGRAGDDAGEGEAGVEMSEISLESSAGRVRACAYRMGDHMRIT